MTLRLALLSSLLVGCQNAPPPAKEFDGQAALAYARTQVDFGPRVPGTTGHQQMAQWLDSLLRTRSDTVVVQRWSHQTEDGDSLPMVNFIARFNPSATQRLLFVAHWDTRPRADADTGAKVDQPIAGANDGASGVAVLIGMADALQKTPPTIGVDLLFVDGEDYGSFEGDQADVLIGAKYYAAHQLPGPKPTFAVLLDMVGGRATQFQKEGYSVVAAPDAVDLVWTTAERLGYGNVFLPENGGSVTDDHIPLQKAGIRAIDIIPDIPNGYPPWHTQADTIDKLSADALKAVGDVMLAVVRLQGR